ncbi:Mercuric reductase [bacterium HR10]|uniref:Mercuric reductase n=1 Tax=uncultured Acidobacteriota bacterium TaxID=171953 RepID=H5SG39_9BACT|nr:mercuric reductase [uncultured Acidobacteriota bacterium]GBC81575.1 Mercuric reductase [bacterium HR10]
MSERTHITLRIEGMTCDGCARHVTEALKNVAGVVEAHVPGWRSGHATVIAEPEVTDEALIRAVRDAGYRALVRERRPLEGERRAPKPEGGDYDLMIIGGGSAAFAAAIKGAELGANVAIVEGGTIGGTCVNIGCVPSKTLIKAAELCYRSAYPKFEGLTACPPPSDWQRVIEQKDELVAALRQGKYINVMDVYPNITLIRGWARLTGRRQVSVNGTTYTPGKIIIATGSRPWAPPIPGLEEAGYLDSTDALSLPALPQSLLIIGAGAIGLELGQLFSRFGVRVTILEAGPYVAGVEEPEIGEALTRYLREEKIRICTGVKIHRVERTADEYRVVATIDDREEVCAAEQLLIATGRRPNTSDLGLDEAGVQIGARGEILVNEHLQTTNPDIYAAGDCIGDPMYVYVAAYAGGIAAENALTGAGRIYDLSALPHVIFTDPQVASVGLTEVQAREKGLKVKTSVLHLKDVPRALAARDTRGLIKLVAEEGTGRLLGAHILADEAGEVIQEATLAIRFGLTIKDLVETFHPYLTMVEGLKLAALTFERDVAKLSCCAT